MEMALHQTLIEVTRHDKLVLWLKKNGLDFAKLGKAIGITRVSVGRLCRSETIPVRRHKQLTALGVPADLLPEPLDLNPGPRRRVEQSAQAAA